MPNDLKMLKVPVKLISEANQREHWTTRSRRKKDQQRSVSFCWVASGFGHEFQFPVVVTLTRIGVRKLDPDNLAGSFKHVQDQIAREMGVDDGDEKRVRWIYEQRKGAPKQYALEVLIQAAA
jgi:hypothetical protein